MPQLSRHSVEDVDAAAKALIDEGVDPSYVSYPCTIGNCKECTGKVLHSPKAPYSRCRCPRCQHPRPRVLRNS